MSDFFSLPPEVSLHSVTFRNSRLEVLQFGEGSGFTGGNKWYKLWGNLQACRQGGYEGIVSFGGDHSNHIAALAELGALEKLPVTGIIRGERGEADTPTLRRAQAQGMKLHYVSRALYRRLRDPLFAREYCAPMGRWWIIPEGGANVEGVEGCRRMAQWIPPHTREAWMAVGTGTMFAGIRSALRDDCHLTGVQVVAAAQQTYIRQHVATDRHWHLTGDFLFGGYARQSSELQAFVEEWNAATGIVIEPVYTGRAFCAAVAAMEARVNEEMVPPLLIHSGGLQYLSD